MRGINKIWLIVLVLLTSNYASAQTYCAKSWKAGETKITEQKFTIHLNKEKSEFKRTIYDSSSNAKYELSVTSGTVGKDKDIIEWMIELESNSKKDKTDLLKPTNDKEQDSFSAEDFPGWFYLGTGNVIKGSKDVLPFLTKRVIKIEGFYCILKVNKYEENKMKRGVIDFVEFQINFINTSDECK